MPRATGLSSRLSLYEEAWESINRLIRRGGSWSGHERKCFYVQGAGGEFLNASAVHGLDVIEDGRGVAVLDLEPDGDPDLVLKSRNAPQVRIWRNDHRSPGSRILVELQGSGGKDGSNAQAIGARVTLRAGGRTRVKEVAAGTGFLSQGSPRLHFGLGDARRVDRLEVRWPRGRVQVLEGLGVDRGYVIREGVERVEERGFVAASEGEKTEKTGGGAGEGAGEGRGTWLIDPVALPELSLRGEKGSVALGSGGEPILLHLWAPECPRCLAELGEWRRAREGAAGGPRVIAATRGAPPGPPGTPEAEHHGAALAAGCEPAAASEEGLLALGVLLEEVIHWPRDLPVPSSLLLDGSGKILKVYRGAVPWSDVARDARSIPATTEERLWAALPFPGRYHATELRRNPFPLGIAYLEAGLPAHARAAFETSIAARPDQADALYNLGVIRQRLGETAHAKDLFVRAIRADPRFVDARVNLAAILAREKRHDEARAELLRALELRGDHLEALLNLGAVELARGSFPEALSAYETAARIEPGNAEVARKMGDARRRMGDVEGALEAYERATRLAPRSGEAWSSLAAIQAQSGRLDAALESALHAIRVEPEHASAHNNAGTRPPGAGAQAGGRGKVPARDRDRARSRCALPESGARAAAAWRRGRGPEGGEEAARDAPGPSRRQGSARAAGGVRGKNGARPATPRLGAS